MKLVHVIPHISAEASGTSYVIPRLCQSLANLGNDVTLSCLVARKDVAGVKTLTYPTWPIARRFAISHSQVFSLFKLADSVDIVHNHSLWSMINVSAGWVVPGRRAKLVVSPHGTLSSWALSHSRYKKMVVWPLQKRLLEQAHLLHATSDEEYQYIRTLGFKAPIMILPNGIDLPHLSERTFTKNRRDLLFLSRVHPTKGIEILLNAWSGLEREHEEWRLRIVGPGESRYLTSLKNLAQRLNLRSVEFEGPLYGHKKYAAYRNADLFVLPTHSENFGMAVAEALSCECPAVVSQGAPWAGLERENCGWWIPNNVESLRETLAKAMALPRVELQMMGARGREWVKRDFSWEKIAKAMEMSYRWLLEEEVTRLPPHVKLD